MQKFFCRSLFVVSWVALLAVTAVAQTSPCPPDPPTASNTGPYFEGSTVFLNASAPAADSYAWTGPNGFVSIEQNPTIANATAANGGLYSVTVTANGCTSNAATTTVEVDLQPTISIGPVSGQPGPKGTLTPFTFTVTLSNPSTETVSVEYYTSNQLAIAGKDYQPTSGTLVFQPLETEKTITVNVYGTRTNTQKTFLVNLYNPVNATIQNFYGYSAVGKGTILAK